MRYLFVAIMLLLFVGTVLGAGRMSPAATEDVYRVLPAGSTVKQIPVIRNSRDLDLLLRVYLEARGYELSKAGYDRAWAELAPNNDPRELLTGLHIECVWDVREERKPKDSRFKPQRLSCPAGCSTQTLVIHDHGGFFQVRCPGKDAYYVRQP